MLAEKLGEIPNVVPKHKWYTDVRAKHFERRVNPGEHGYPVPRPRRMYTGNTAVAVPTDILLHPDIRIAMNVRKIDNTSREFKICVHPESICAYCVVFRNLSRAETLARPGRFDRRMWCNCDSESLAEPHQTSRNLQQLAKS